MKKEQLPTSYEKLSLAEYEQRYSSKSNTKAIKVFAYLLAATIGVVIFVCLFALCKDAYEINQYLGYGAIAASVLAFVFLYIVPLVKIKRLRKFELDVNAYSVKSAKKHNAKIRRELANNVIDLYLSTEGGSSGYSDEHVSTLVNARQSGDDKQLMMALDVIYAQDVKRGAKDIIRRCAIRSGIFSAVSQKNTSDTLIVTLINLQMIKDIVFLYGFRPSDAKLMKIFANVVTNSLVAYGLGSANIGNQVARSIGGVAEQIPILGGLIGAVVDSSIQGLSNATLTALLGHNTIRYLMKEYRLQSILESVEISESEEEFAETCEALKQDLTEAKKAKKDKKGELVKA
ncbi:MAG: YcjF family protein [Bacilli bacterium]|nr:YcjF family protein [Bacilli bacterium]